MNVLIGSGRVASMLLSFKATDEEMYVFSRNEQTVEKLANEFPTVKKCTKDQLANASTLFICLPSESYKDFFQSNVDTFSKNVTIYHMATALMEEEVSTIVNGRKVIPLKVVGHAAQAEKEGNGLVALPKRHEAEYAKLKKWFPTLSFHIASEEEVLLANQIGTEAAIQMLITLETKMKELGLSKEVIQHTTKQTVVGNIQAYHKNNLGQFAKKIMKQVQEKGGVSSDENG